MSLDFASLPTSHPIRQYCRRWDIQNPSAQDALVELAKEIIEITVHSVVENEHHRTVIEDEETET